jgi:hypothetical protein
MGMPFRSLLLLTAGFWIYVTVSNVLYAHSMQVNLTAVTHVQIFASAPMRIGQHLVLFPVVLGCYAASLAIGWGRAHRAAIQACLALAFSAAAFWALALVEYVVMLLAHEASWDMHEDIGALWLASFISVLPTYGFGLALVSGFAIYHRYREAQLRASTLEREWSSARLATLRMQLSPHTLFNLLHTIQGQIKREPDTAQDMVVGLGDLLRRLLQAGARDFSLLEEELHFAALYLELQRQRFPDRLSFSLPDPATLPKLWVPSLILQPLVENAVVHGMDDEGGRLEVRIEARAEDDEVVLQVTNAIGRAGPSAGGVGLANVRERIAVQFGERAVLEAGPRGAEQWLARLTMSMLRDRAAI